MSKPKSIKCERCQDWVHPTEPHFCAPVAACEHTASTEDLLRERGKTHGSFEVNARVAQTLKQVLRNNGHYDNLCEIQKEALDFICSKIGRIMSGQPGFQDHWDDIAGYAKLAAKPLREQGCK